MIGPSCDVPLNWDALLDVGDYPATKPLANALANVFGDRETFGTEEVHGVEFGFELFDVMGELAREMLFDDVSDLMEEEEDALVVFEGGDIEDTLDVAACGAVPLVSVLGLRDAIAPGAMTLDEVIDPLR